MNKDKVVSFCLSNGRKKVRVIIDDDPIQIIQRKKL